jgi:hypothetical protein
MKALLPLSLCIGLAGCLNVIAPGGVGDEAGEILCGDGVDNDGDGDTDCRDDGCASTLACADREDESGELCRDGEDNDDDGRVDCADPGCADRVFCGEELGAACGDGIDNDADGAEDCDDDGCAGAVACGGEAPEPAPGDADGDGLVDEDELIVGTDPALADTDGDGLLDGAEVLDVLSPADEDEDGRIDALESAVLDCDGDGRADQRDARDQDREGDDRDLDGVLNADDADDDADGIVDDEDPCPWSATTCSLDEDGDGIRNKADVCPCVEDADQADRDGDRVGDACDAFPDDPALQADAAEPCLGGVCELVVEEVLYRLSTAGGATLLDANGDGAADASDDEFVELRNNTERPLDLSGVALFDEATFGDPGAARHVVPAGTVLQPGELLLVFGGGAPASISRGVVQVASSGSLGLNNGGDEVFVVGVGGELISSLAFGAEDAAVNVSLTRYPEGALQLVSHDVAGLEASPGRCPDL